MFLKIQTHPTSLSFLSVLSKIKRRRVTPLARLKKYFSQGVSYLPNEKNLSMSLSLFQKSLKLCNKFYPTFPLEDLLMKSEISLALYENGHVEQSLDYLGKSAEILSHNSSSFNKKSLFLLYQNLIKLYFKQEKFKSVDTFVPRALDILQDQPVDSQIKFMMFLVYIKIESNEYIEALNYCLKYFKNCESLNIDDSTLMKIYLYFVVCYKRLNQLEEALKTLTKCVEILPAVKYYNKGLYIELVFMNLSEVQVDLDQGEDAVESVLAGGKMLKSVVGPEGVLEFYKQAWKIIELQDADNLIEEMEQLNDSLYRDNPKGNELLSLLSKHSIGNRNFEEAIKYRQKILNIYKKNNMNENCIDCYMILANLYMSLNPELAKTYILIVEKMIQSNHSFEHMINLLWYKYYKTVNNADSALKYFQLYSKTYPENKISQLKAVDDHFDFADFMHTRNRFDRSIELYNKTLELNEKNKANYSLNKVELLSSLGVAHRNKKNFDLSLDYLFQAVEQNKTKKENIGQVRKIYYEVMSTYLEMNEFHLALEYAKENLRILENEGHSSSYTSGITCYNIGFAYEKLLDRKNAKEFYMKAKEIFLYLREFENVQSLIESIQKLD